MLRRIRFLTLCVLPFFLVMLPFQCLGEVKLGFEVQVTNVNYASMGADFKKLRHLRLFTIKHDNQEIAYIEVDGSNRDLEFVSNPILGNDKTKENVELLIDKLFIPFLRNVIEEGCENSEKYIVPKKATLLIPISKDNFHKFFPNIQNISVEMAGGFGEGFNVEIGRGIKGIEGVKVSPQTTYQILLKNVPEFYNTLEKMKILDKGEILTPDMISDIKGVSAFLIANKIKEERAKDFIGFYWLINQYLVLLGRYKNDYPDFSINQGWAKEMVFQKRETGMKQFLPVMSRISFSDMYHHNMPLENLSVFNDALNYLAKVRGNMSFPNYKITSNIHADFQSVRRALDDKTVFSPQEWIASIKSRSGSRHISAETTEEVGFLLNRLIKYCELLATKKLNKYATHLGLIAKQQSDSGLIGNLLLQLEALSLEINEELSSTFEKETRELDEQIARGQNVSLNVKIKGLMKHATDRIRVAIHNVEKKLPANVQRTDVLNYARLLASEARNNLSFKVSKEDARQVERFAVASWATVFEQKIISSDILYPVPFKNMADSMGNFAYHPSLKGHAVLEVRRTASAFNKSGAEPKIMGLSEFISTQFSAIASAVDSKLQSQGAQN